MFTLQESMFLRKNVNSHNQDLRNTISAFEIRSTLAGSNERLLATRVSSISKYV